MNNNDFDIMGQETITPQLNKLEIKAKGNPFQMRGLFHVLSTVYTQEMSLDDYQMAIAKAVQKTLEEKIANLDPQTTEIITTFLQSVDYSLVNDYNEKVTLGITK